MLGGTSKLDEHKGFSDSRIPFFLDTRTSLIHSDFLISFFEQNSLLTESFRKILMKSVDTNASTIDICIINNISF